MDGSTGLLGSPASQLRSKPVLSNPALRQYNKLAFTDSAVNLPQTNAVVLKFEPQREYPRSNRVIKHSTDKFVLDTDYPSERKSMGSSVGGDSAKSFSSDYLSRPKPSMHPEYTSLNSRSSSSYRKAQSNGRYRKVTLAKLESLTRSYEARKENDDGSSLGSLSVSVDPLHTKSLDDLFSATYMEREGVQKQLDEENCFTSKVHTPRLLQADPEAHFKSKDLLNAMIEDVSGWLSLFAVLGLVIFPFISLHTAPPCSYVHVDSEHQGAVAGREVHGHAEGVEDHVRGGKHQLRLGLSVC